ncbi:MAG: Trp family transcriptional regulator [bacterium]
MKTDHLQKISTDLQQALLQLHTRHDVFSFLRDLLTADEIVELSLRFDIAQRLYRGHHYKDIEQET